MPRIALNERKVLLLLFKDFSVDYNAGSLSSKLKISRRGALKIVKKLKAQRLLISRQYGKATFYKINLDDAYSQKALELLLMEEAKEKASRWLAEFHPFFPLLQAAVIFGSAIRDYEKAKDIDLLLVFRKAKYAAVRELIQNKNKILLKPIHPIIQAPQDIIHNLQKPDPVVLNALRLGYVLHGYDTIIKAVQRAQKSHGHFAVPLPESR